MNITATVHRVALCPTERMVSYQGAEVLATLNVLEVELVTDSDLHGNLTLRFDTADSIAEATTLFVIDSHVTISLGPVGA